jgi:hypothetical protein
VWQTVLGSGFVQAIAPFLNRTDARINSLDGRAEWQVFEEGFAGSAEVICFASWHMESLTHQLQGFVSLI